MVCKAGRVFRRYVYDVLTGARLPASDSALNLIVMIAANESGGFRYVRQMHGPALGLLQMEPVTYHCTCDYARHRGFELPRNPLLLIMDTSLAIKAARLFFMRIPAQLPKADHVPALALYAKQHWNTQAGKATVDDYVNAYERYCV